MPFIDQQAASKLRALREERGLSPEALAAEIQQMVVREGWSRGAVAPYTIRRAEGNPRTGRPAFVPGPRVRFVIAHYFEMRPDEIWQPAARIQVQTGAIA